MSFRGVFIDTPKRVAAAGIAEIILYFNVGLKPHAQVKDEMARFAAESRRTLPADARNSEKINLV